MNVLLKKVAIEDKQVLRNLLELYRYDFSEFDKGDVNDHGLYGYRYLDHYWTEPGRHPFFIVVDDFIAGFILVSNFCYMCEPGDARSISEFFVMKKYRRTGIGETAARAVFKMYPGKWEVVQHPENKPSMEFWEKVISDITRGQYRKLEAETKDWTGQALIFSNRSIK
ncbi:MAG: GNAT family N-acetyltransferase [Candidatus Sabulitectum sp.]|nr:GNAT family N-acetyltransferase [Candidatus Sabulitectum sp.]